MSEIQAKGATAQRMAQHAAAKRSEDHAAAKKETSAATEDVKYDPTLRQFFVWALHVIAIVGLNLSMTKEYDWQRLEPAFSFNFTSSIAVILSLVFFTLVLDIAKGCNR